MKIKTILLILICIVIVNSLRAQTLISSGINATDMNSFDGNVYFSAYDANYIHSEPYFCDGSTGQITKLLTNTSTVIPSGYMKVGSQVFFGFSDGINDAQLWKTDGSASGTSLVKIINPTGPAVSFSNYKQNIAYNNKLVFAADNGVSGSNPYESDGTSAGTKIIQNLQPLQNYSASPRKFALINNKIVYVVNSSWQTGPYAFYSYDGTANTLISSNPVSNVYTLSDKIMDIGNKGYFLANNNGNMTYVIETDGVTLTTPNGFLGTQNMVFNGTDIIFDKFNVATGYELYKCGTNFQNETMIKDILPGGGAIHNIFNLTVMNNIAYFFSSDGVNGTELWRSDGSATGTFMVKDINPGATGSMGGSFNSMPSIFVNCNKLYFRADDGTHGDELWSSDGTSAGTQMVMDINPGSQSSNITEIAASAGRIFFVATDGNLWGQFYKIEDCYTPPAPAAPAAPTNLAVLPLKVESAGKMKLSWTDNSNNESGFRIERSSNGSTGWAIVDSVGANLATFTQSGLPASTPFYYRVYAHANSLHSAYSNVAGGNTLGLTEIRDEERINIFPNPANNVINFTELTRNSKANLFDINGKLCMSLLLKKGTSQIDISELSKGNYLLQITDDKSAARKSVFIKN